MENVLTLLVALVAVLGEKCKLPQRRLLKANKAPLKAGGFIAVPQTWSLTLTLHSFITGPGIFTKSVNKPSVIQLGQHGRLSSLMSYG